MTPELEQLRTRLDKERLYLDSLKSSPFLDCPDYQHHETSLEDEVSRVERFIQDLQRQLETLDKRTLGEQLRDARKALNLSQSDLEIEGFSRVSYSRVENDSLAPVDRVLRHICKVLKLNKVTVRDAEYDGSRELKDEAGNIVLTIIYKTEK